MLTVYVCIYQGAAVQRDWVNPLFAPPPLSTFGPRTYPLLRTDIDI